MLYLPKVAKKSTFWLPNLHKYLMSTEYTYCRQKRRHIMRSTFLLWLICTIQFNYYDPTCVFNNHFRIFALLKFCHGIIISCRNVSHVKTTFYSSLSLKFVQDSFFAGIKSLLLTDFHILKRKNGIKNITVILLF